MHIPVLIREFLEFFEGKKIRFFIDATLGGAGHSFAILERHPEIEMLFGIDQDEEALEVARMRLEPFKNRFQAIQGDFRNISNLIPEIKVDGILFDLGFSEMQLQKSERGFSFQREGPLDMRKNLNSNIRASDIIQNYSEKELADLFWKYGEETRSRRAAAAIVEARKKRKIKTTTDLLEVLGPVLTWRGRKNKNIHPMTLVFQALRIEVNEELEGLKETLPQSIDLLNPSGRLCAISFHSLEDRIVKHYFREIEKEGHVQILTKKPKVPSEEEISHNPHSRSAKMRVIEKR